MEESQVFSITKIGIEIPEETEPNKNVKRQTKCWKAGSKILSNI